MLLFYVIYFLCLFCFLFFFFFFSFFFFFLFFYFFFFFFFFFQAEDGIRDDLVTEFRRVLFRSDTGADGEHGHDGRPRHARDREGSQLKARRAAAELDLVAPGHGAPRLDLHADDLVAAERLQDGEPGEDGAVGVDHLEAVPAADGVHEVAHARVGLVRDHHVDGTPERGQVSRRHLPRAEVPGQGDQPAVLGEGGLEDLGADGVEHERPRPRAPLLHRLGHRARKLGEHPVGVPALAEPAARTAHRSTNLALVGEHRCPLRARDREDDGRDHRRGAALPPLGAVNAAELREAAPRRPVEAQRGAEPPPVHGPPRLAERARSGKRLQGLARRLQRDAALGAELAVDQRTAAQQDRAAEVAHDLHLDAQLVADTHLAQHAEVVHRGEVAGARRAALRSQERAPALRERLDHEGGGQPPVTSDARVRRAHQLRERSRPLADLEHAVEEQEGRPVGQARDGIEGRFHTASRRSGRQSPPRARPSTAATRTARGRAAPVTTSRPARAEGASPQVGGTRPVETASAAAAAASAPAAPKSPRAPRTAVTVTRRPPSARASAAASSPSSSGRPLAAANTTSASLTVRASPSASGTGSRAQPCTGAGTAKPGGATSRARMRAPRARARPSGSRTSTAPPSPGHAPSAAGSSGRGTPHATTRPSRSTWWSTAPSSSAPPARQTSTPPSATCSAPQAIAASPEASAAESIAVGPVMPSSIEA